MANKAKPQNGQRSEQDIRVLAAFMSPGGRLPGFAQRRLDELIIRGNEGELTVTEQQELSEALEYVDEKSIELMAYAAEMVPPAPSRHWALRAINPPYGAGTFKRA